MNEKVLGISEKVSAAAPFASVPFARWLRESQAGRRRWIRGKNRAFCDLSWRLQLSWHRDRRRPRARKKRLLRDAARSSVLRHSESRWRRPGRGKAQGSHERRVALAGARPEGMTIVIPGPSCSYTVRKEYPELLGTAEAKRVAESVVDLMEFVDRLRKEKKLNRDLEDRLRQSGVPCGVSPSRAEDRNARRARARALAGDGGRGDRQVLRRRRHVGNEGAALRDGSEICAKARARDCGRRTERSS